VACTARLRRRQVPRGICLTLGRVVDVVELAVLGNTQSLALKRSHYTQTHRHTDTCRISAISYYTESTKKEISSFSCKCFKVVSWYVFCMCFVFCISYLACILCSEATVRAHLSLVCLVQLPGLLCYRIIVLLLLNKINYDNDNFGKLKATFIIFGR